MDFNSENMSKLMPRNVIHDGKSLTRASFLYENSTVSYFMNSGSRSLTIESNTTTAYIVSNTTYLERDETVAVLEMTVSATILFLAIVGNSCVILSLATRRKRLSRMHLMILHLSLADLFVAFFNVLPQLAWDITHTFIGGHFLCVSVKYVQVVAMYASSYVLLATAVDRFYAICHPFVTQTWTGRHAHTLAVIAWVASLFFSLPQVFIFSYRLREVVPGVSIYDCWAQFNPEWTLRAYITWMTASIFVVPTCVLGILYGKITWVVWKAGKVEENMMTKFSPTKIASNRSSLSNSNHCKVDKPFLSEANVDAKYSFQTSRDTVKMGVHNGAMQKINASRGASERMRTDRCIPKTEIIQPGENGGSQRHLTRTAKQFTQESFHLAETDPVYSSQVSTPTNSEVRPSSQLLSVCLGGPLHQNQHTTPWSYANKSKHKPPGDELTPEDHASVAESLDSNLHAKNGSGWRGRSAMTPVDAADSPKVTLSAPHGCGVEVTDEGCTSQTGPGLIEVTVEERPDKHTDVTSRLQKGYLTSVQSTRSRLKSDVKLDSRDPDVETLRPSEMKTNKKRRITNERSIVTDPDMTCLDSCLQKRASFGKHKHLTQHGKGYNSNWEDKPNMSEESRVPTLDASESNRNYARQNSENNFDNEGCQFLMGGYDTRKGKTDSSVSLSHYSTENIAASDRTITKTQRGASFSHRFSCNQRDSHKNGTTSIVGPVNGSNKISDDRSAGNDRSKTVVSPGSMGISRAKIKTIKMTLTVVICYVLCWAPFFVGQMWAAYDENAPYDGPFFSIIMLLASVNSCTNPWIYTIFSNTICQRTQEVLTAPCRWLARACRTHPRFGVSQRSSAHSVCLRPFPRAGERRKLFQHSSFSTFG